MPHKLENMLANAEVSVEFEDEREEALIRLAVQGKDVHEFLESTVGRFVIGAARQDQVDIENKLTSLKPNTPWRRRKIVELQQEYEAIGLAIQWLTEAVRIGMAVRFAPRVRDDGVVEFVYNPAA